MNLATGVMQTRYEFKLSEIVSMNNDTNWYGEPITIIRLCNASYATKGKWYMENGVVKGNFKLLNV